MRNIGRFDYSKLNGGQQVPRRMEANGFVSLHLEDDDLDPAVLQDVIDDENAECEDMEAQVPALQIKEEKRRN